jgi:hypothetical protein
MSELPNELVEIAKNVNVEKRNEVQNVLNSVFAGVSKMREQLDLVEVTSEDDKVNMKLANTIRLGIRQVRLDAERTFDQKRSEVQELMISYKTLDQLWLKGKQVTQIMTKELEANAKWKEETKIRFDAEAKEFETQQRMIEVKKFDSEINRIEFEKMSSDSFDIFLSGVEVKFNKKIDEEKRIESERLAKIKADEDERERMKKENERLRRDAEKKEKERVEEKAKAEILRYEAIEKANQEKAKADSILAEEKAKSDIARKKAELLAREDSERLEAIVATEKAARLDLENQAKKKADEELRINKAIQAKAEAEKKAELEALKAPKKVKLTNWVNDFTIITPSGMSEDETVKDIMLKFESFKNWAKKEIEKL